MQQAATCQRLCHAACRDKKQAARQSLATINHSDIPGLSCRLQKNSKRPASPNESTQSKEVGHQLHSHIPPLIGPTPLLAKEQQGRSTAPAAGRQPLRGQKTFPVGRAEDMPVCLFAQGPFASAEYLVQLTSSLAQKVCLARGSPCPPGEWLKSHIAQPRHPKP